jgi:ferritin-like metal-binding protein YciE
MTEAHNEIVLTWLDDAYTIEHALIHVLERHGKEAKEHPEIQERIDEHLAQTRRHAELVAGRITALGGEPKAHEGMVGVLAPLQSLLTGAADDETVLANSIADYAGEDFEIATYQALVAAAQDNGDAETARVCREILADEQAMAAWLDDHMPPLVDRIVRAAS